MMLKVFLSAFLIYISFSTCAQPQDETAIRKLMAAQEFAWNKGNIPGFMEGYWKSDSLLFVGKNGPKYGWQQTLDNYQKSYPDTIIMGQLHFDIVQVKQLSSEYYFVLGKWSLKRTKGDAGGAFTLLFRKFKNSWKIVADHSS